MTTMETEVIEHEQEITAAATTEQIPVISDYVESMMGLAGFGSRKVMEVLLAVEEACTNVAKYAYPGKAGTVHIVARVHGDRLELIIEDEGIPFDPTTHIVALSQADTKDHPIGGLGIHLIRCYVDRMSFEFRDGKNVLTLVKNRDK
ncbi:MAG: serine/threonine-protein kinase RsbW [Euryarchaeota archaeon]|nr:serine/threonine-protein kinase RsbW [Euryarchaeota archaeon]